MTIANSVSRVAVLMLLIVAGTAHGETVWTTDQNGCKLASPNPKPDETVTWSGRCVDGVAEGSGVQQWSANGQVSSTFTGTLARGLAVGHGVLQEANGNSYEGEFLAGKRDGPGIYKWSNGDRYTGQFAQGKMTGKGAKYFANGNVYEGDWANSKPSGTGAMKFFNGDAYEGHFNGGALAGNGAYQWANGDRYVGVFSGSTLWGDGRYQTASGNRYEGMFSNGKPLGYGSAVSAQGWRYDGEFRGGNPTGAGTYRNAAGEVLPTPVGGDVEHALQFDFRATEPASRATVTSAKLVCTQMGKPTVPALGSNWKGQAKYKATATVREGLVVGATIEAVSKIDDASVNKLLVDSIHHALIDTYLCPGEHVFEQEFVFSYN